MGRANVKGLRFVRALLPAQTAFATENGDYELQAPNRVARLGPAAVRQLMAQGVLLGDIHHCRPSSEAQQWVQRQRRPMADHASQHQDLHTDSAAITRNLNESPLARLARAEAGQGAPFLLPHQIEAGERLRHMVARAQLVARTTMSYDASRTISAKAGPNLGAELGDTAIDARRRLDAIAKILAPDCAHVVFDVCGLLKGLQVVEQERGWPRRSAKLVLRIGLEQLASYFGLAAHSAGAAARGTYAWLETRPQKFE